MKTVENLVELQMSTAVDFKSLFQPTLSVFKACGQTQICYIQNLLKYTRKFRLF